MCGIAGFTGDGSRLDIERMTRALAHRGPDGEGFHFDEASGVFLGHRRLAIVDIADGEQPMWSRDGGIGVVFNGEIYNHVELRQELERRGHKFFTSHSDTEVLVHGYRQWGEDLPRRLNGMFAFAIYDRRKHQLFLARDRYGEKPLYYAHSDRLFGFASELTALAQHRDVDRSLDVRSLQKFFAFGYLPGPHAMLKGTRKLPGGHWLCFDLASRKLTVKAYWRFEMEPDDGLTDADEPRLVEECAALLEQAARRRLMSDVPVGVFLSGGLDSSLVLASLTKFLPAQQLSSFTIGFTEPSFDESAYARSVASHLGTAHHERVLDLERASELIPSVLSRFDEPLGDASLLPTHLLSAFACEKVTVALTGDGGDELFAGYDAFLALKPGRIYARLVSPSLHKGARRLADLLPVSPANMSFDFRIKRVLMSLTYPEKFWFPVGMSPVEPNRLHELFDMPVRIDDIYDDVIESWDQGDANKPVVDKALEFLMRFYLPDDLLMKSDRAAMMSSLETRAVFLDNDLVEFCRRLPNRFKFRNGERKYLLKKVARRLLPDTIVDRKKKGFGIPLAKWLRETPKEPPLAPIAGVDGDFARAAFTQHRQGMADRRFFLWGWLAVQAFAARIAGGAQDERAAQPTNFPARATRQVSAALRLGV